MRISERWLWMKLKAASCQWGPWLGFFYINFKLINYSSILVKWWMHQLQFKPLILPWHHPLKDYWTSCSIYVAGWSFYSPISHFDVHSHSQVTSLLFHIIQSNNLFLIIDKTTAITLLDESNEQNETGWVANRVVATSSSSEEGKESLSVVCFLETEMIQEILFTSSISVSSSLLLPRHRFFKSSIQYL